jgi:anaerobic magnesium-protoporphyrin IX monomethyl ester cyclase
MRLALVYPPACDPTAPYVALPALSGFLRANGVDVLAIDANVEAFDALLDPAALGSLRDRLEARLRELDRRASLPHAEQLEYLALARARRDAHAVPHGIARAKAVLRDEGAFHDPDAYGSAVGTVDAALRVVSATHHPLHLDFTAYRTPFGLTAMAELDRASRAGEDPFDNYVVDTLVPRLRAAEVDIVGLSICFPGQFQPAYAFALKLKRALPHVHLTCGGPGITQILIRLQGQRLAQALGPFDSACVFEGEHTLLRLLQAIDDRREPGECENVIVRDEAAGARWRPGHDMEDLKSLPPPDFDGLPLAKYFAPRLVLPYDPTRGCYWGKCAFCHYGLTPAGTAKYRERDPARVADHLRELAGKYRTRHFYLSQDSVAPHMLVRLAEAFLSAGLDIRWGTDLKPEKYLTRQRTATLRKAGAVACALGVESGSDRVLKLINKGAPAGVVSDVIDNLSAAGIAAEAMCFTDFPTETHEEAVATLEFIADRRNQIAVYIVGDFGLTHGSLVAQSPSRFGIRETWELEGDLLGLGIFFAPVHPWKTDAQNAAFDERLEELSTGWALRRYPWAGAVSTAHTILYYDRRGPGVFRTLARRGLREGIYGAKGSFESDLQFDLRALCRAEQREGAIWAALVGEQRRVGRAPYEALASQAPSLRPKPARVTFTAGAEPIVATRRRKPKGRRS